MSGGVDNGQRPSRKQLREIARRERRAKEETMRRAARTRRGLRLGGGLLSLLLVAAALVLLTRGGSAATAGSLGRAASLKLASLAPLGHLDQPDSPGPLGPEGVPAPTAPLLAGTETAATGRTVDGIECSADEQTLFHIHAHLTIFVDGTARQIPYGIGTPGAKTELTPQGPFVATAACFYWLHTHSADGIIHIESPVVREYTLGDFFDEWGQPLGPDRVGAAKGSVTAIYNGRRVEGSPRVIPLTAHAQIQLEVGLPLVAPEKINFPEGL
jgi:hypothetical protein